MLGREFARALRSAQAGDERAFAQLWRDANPVMIRYLRVVGVDDPYDAACEGWITVVRGLPGFKGDETAWRVWLLACARMRAEEGSLRRSWSPLAAVPPDTVTDDLLIDTLDEGSEDAAHRGVKETIAAIRGLPLGQGEIVMLRLAAELPVGAVADIVGVDAATVRRAEARGIERLGADRDLLLWSLAAPAMPAELADERVALGAFRSMPKSARGQGAPRATILTLGTSFDRRPRRVELADAQVVSIVQPLTREPGHPAVKRRPAVPGGHPVAGVSTSATVSALPTSSSTRSATRAAARAAAGAASGRRAAAPRVGLVAGRSRTALIGLVAASVSVVSLSGISAAAFVGVLPAGPQQALHDLLGAPAPQDSSGNGSSGLGTRPDGTPVGPAPTSSAGRGLCQAWASDKAKGTSREKSIAFRNLAAAAGDASKVDAYCRVAATVTTNPAPAKTPNPHAPTAKPTKTPPTKTPPTRTPPSRTPAVRTPPAKTPNAQSPTTKAANPNSPTKTAKSADATTPAGPSKSSQRTATPGSTPEVMSTEPGSLDSVSQSAKPPRGTGSPPG